MYKSIEVIDAIKMKKEYFELFIADASNIRVIPVTPDDSTLEFVSFTKDGAPFFGVNKSEYMSIVMKLKDLRNNTHLKLAIKLENDDEESGDGVTTLERYAVVLTKGLFSVFHVTGKIDLS